MKTVGEIAWRIGGPQGSGVDTAARLFAQAASLGGLFVFGRREYYSNIMGRHSYYDVRLSASSQPPSHRIRVDLLSTFESETLARHALSVIPGGGIIYDIRDEQTPFVRITFLDDRVRQDLHRLLEEEGVEDTTTVGGLLELARRRNVQLYPVAYDDLFQALSEKMGVPLGIAQRTRNTLAVALSFALLEFPRAYLKDALSRIFKGKEKVIHLNQVAVDMVYDYIAANHSNAAFDFRLEGIETSEPLMLLNGNQSVAIGKIAGGLTFQTYYPISPATDESVYLEGHATYRTVEGDEQHVVVVQTEDEISAIAMACGAALTGARAATATSGPGFSLMVEQLGWASMTETPIVITLYMRGGPSTGMPTRTDQGDLFFALFAGHGEAPRIVYASPDVEEAFYDAIRVLNYAEVYQMPVIHLMDKALVSTTTTLPLPDPKKVPIQRGEIFVPEDTENGHHIVKRYDVDTPTGVSPRVLLGTPHVHHWMTGGEHTEEGRVTEDPIIRVRMHEKRLKKLAYAAQTIPVEDKFQVYGPDNADFTVISWGSTRGAILEALQVLESQTGQRGRLVHVKLLMPFPHELKEVLDNEKPLVLVELTATAQMERLLRMELGIDVDYRILKYSGRPFSYEELVEAFQDVLQNKIQTHMVVQPWE